MANVARTGNAEDQLSPMIGGPGNVASLQNHVRYVSQIILILEVKMLT